MRIRTVLTAFLATAALLTGASLSGLASAEEHAAAPAERKVTTMTFEGRGLSVSLKEIQQKIEGTLGQTVGPANKVFVITNNGTFLTDEQIKALRAGIPSSDFDLLMTVDKPRDGLTLGDLDRGSGPVAKQKGKKFTFDWGPLHVEATIDYELWPPSVTADVQIKVSFFQ